MRPADFLHSMLPRSMRTSPGCTAAAVLAVMLIVAGQASWTAAAEPKSLGIETVSTADGKFVLTGGDARAQLIVTGTIEGDKLRDFTHAVSYQVDPAEIASVDENGYVTPLANGEATITARHESGQEASVKLNVERIGQEFEINFPNQIVPIFTKLTCNSGGCHGKASGQNGFKLALLGFEPPEDYEHLVLEGQGRRVFVPDPDRSLLLLKPIGAMPHGGGQLMEKDDYNYRLIRRWIEQGMPYGDPDAAKVARIEVIPRERMMQPATSQQIAVVAHYTDGRTEDVTHTAQFESNASEMADVNKKGLVAVSDLPGSVAIMVRYQGHVDVFRATVPLGADVENLPQGRNFIDEFVFRKLKTLGLPPSQVCDDETFIRRVTLDLVGRLPTVQEVEAFLADNSQEKRDRLIDRLLASHGHAEYFAAKWNAILRNKRRSDEYKQGSYIFHAWILRSLHENKPYDEFVREILTATGEIRENPPVAWYREVNEINQQVEDTAQLFLGMRIQCARCHHHPFEKWSQQDYYGLAAFFSQVSTKQGSAKENPQIYHKIGNASARNPKTGDNVPPTGLDAEPADLTPYDDPRYALADWMGSPENEFFAKTFVNRYWKHFFGRGLVDPEDDMRATNPATHPELLDALADHFVDSGYDMKDLMRTICQSTIYQLESEPNEHNASDRQNFSRNYPERLPAEVLLDAIDVLTGTETRFSGMPAGTRAVALPDTGFDSYFLSVFGRPEADSACECERSGDASLAQGLHLINSPSLQSKIGSGSGTAAQMAKTKPEDKEATAENIRQLYLMAVARQPTEEETAKLVKYIEERSDNTKTAYEDIVWMMINTKEFLFNH